MCLCFRSSVVSFGLFAACLAFLYPLVSSGLSFLGFLSYFTTGFTCLTSCFFSSASAAAAGFLVFDLLLEEEEDEEEDDDELDRPIVYCANLS